MLLVKPRSKASATPTAAEMKKPSWEQDGFKIDSYVGNLISNILFKKVKPS
jgi:hypothetical protein